VPALLEALFSEVRTSLASFDADPEAPKYEASAVHLAVWAHARFISIHPFEDGNGRIGRLWMSWTLDRLHLVPLSIEAPKQEYLEGLNIFYRTGELQPLIDLFLDIYLQNAEPM
jgi:Fic family protein